MQNKSVYFVKILILLVVTFFISSAGIYQKQLLKNDVKVDKGNYISTDNNKQNLNGEWEFYYGKLLVTDNITDYSDKEYINVPSRWNSNKEYNIKGYASYRCLISGIKKDEILSIGFDNLTLDYSIYVNREYIGGSGVVSKTLDKITESKANGDQFDYEYYVVNSDEPLEIIIEVSSITSGGLYKNPILFLNKANVAFVIDKLIQKAIIIGLYLISLLMHSCKVFVEKKSNYILGFILIALLTIYSLLSGTIYAFIMDRINLFSAIFADMIVHLIQILICIIILINIYTSKYKKRSIIGIILISSAYVLILIMNCLKTTGVFDGGLLYIWLLCLHVILITIAILFLFVDEKGDLVIYMNELSLISLCIVGYFKTLNESGFIYFATRNVESIFTFLAIGFSLTGYFIVQKRTLEIAKNSTKLTVDNTNFRINLLLNQIKPHFLYNTLNSINSLCKIDPNEASKAIVSFSSYLRNNMDSISDSNLISVSKELEHVRTYIDIEKMRFRDRLNVDYEINATKFNLPPLSIQAIVENAIKHGMSSKIQGVKIVIKTYEDEDFNYVYISDNGVGFDINSITESDSVGLSNVCRRLEMLCKGELQFSSIINNGTTAIIKLNKEMMKE